MAALAACAFFSAYRFYSMAAWCYLKAAMAYKYSGGYGDKFLL